MITKSPYESPAHHAARVALIERRRAAEEMANAGVVEARAVLATDGPDAALAALCRTAADVLAGMAP